MIELSLAFRQPDFHKRDTSVTQQVLGAAMLQRAKTYRDGRLNRLVFYRNRAEELRALAEGFPDSRRKTLLDVAAAYDMLAAELTTEMKLA